MEQPGTTEERRTERSRSPKRKARGICSESAKTISGKNDTTPSKKNYMGITPSTCINCHHQNKRRKEGLP